MRRPSRTTRLRRKPCCVRRSQAPRPWRRSSASDLLARDVGALGGEQAVGQREDLVEAAGSVEAAHQLAVLAFAEGVLELVAVAPLLERRDHRRELVALEPADAGQRVVDLLLLDRELALVGEHLPGRAGVVGERLDALGGRLEDLDGAGLGVGALGLADDGADAVAGHGAGDEDDVAVLTAGDAVAAVGEAVDGELELGAAVGAVRAGG